MVFATIEVPATILALSTGLAYYYCHYYEDLPDEIFGELVVMLSTFKKAI